MSTLSINAFTYIFLLGAYQNIMYEVRLPHLLLKYRFCLFVTGYFLVPFVLLKNIYLVISDSQIDITSLPYS